MLDSSGASPVLAGHAPITAEDGVQSLPAPASSRRRAIVGALHIVGPALAGKAGLKLHIGGNGVPHATKDAIHLPALPLDDDAADTLGLGLVWHESNHHNWTEFDVLEREQPTPFLHGTWNALEDIRCDSQGQQRHPGARFLCEDMIQRLIASGQIRASSTDDPPARKLQSYLYWRLATEVLKLPVADRLAETSENVAVEAFSEAVMVKLDGLMSKIHGCDSTQAVMDLAKRIVGLLEEESKEPPQPSQGGDGDPDVSPDGDGAAEGDGSGGGQQDCDPGSGPTPEQRKAISDALSSGTKEQMQDVGDAVAKELQRVAHENRRDAFEVASDGGGFSPSGGAPFGDEKFDLDVREASNGVRVRCARVLVAKTLQHRVRRMSGTRVDTKRLVGISVGNYRVFQKERAPEIKTDTAALLLADRSGSTGHIINVIRESVYAAALGLEQIPRVSVAAAAFPSESDGVVPLKHFGQRAPSRSGAFSCLSAGGGTPMAEAMLWASQQLSAQRQSRKFVLVVTDGCYDPERGLKVINLLARHGIGSYAIAVGEHADASWFPVSRKILSVDSLPAALFELLMVAVQREGIRT